MEECRMKKESSREREKGIRSQQTSKRTLSEQTARSHGHSAEKHTEA